jgi:hypothetical protein
MDKIIGWGMFITAMLTLWAVTTDNHLYIG